jgi:hypothetical protein
MHNRRPRGSEFQKQPNFVRASLPLSGKLELAKASRKKSRSSLEPIQRSMYCCLADRNVPKFPRKVWCKTNRLCYGSEYVCGRPPAPANV